MIEVALGALIWTFILQHAASLAQSVAQNVGAEEFKSLLSTFTLQRKVQNAVNRAYARFQTQINDPNLVAALERDGSFGRSPEVARILAQAALNPPDRDAQARELSALMSQFAPGFPGPRRESAARLLIEQIHREISGIRPLREGLLMLETQRVRKRQERPEYAPGLYQCITHDARAIAARRNQHQITTGHLLYAILAQPGSIAAWALGALNITANKVADSLVIIDPQSHLPPGEIGPGAARALERARDLARDCGAVETGTEHVLLALAALALETREGTTIRAIFGRIGVDPQAIYEAASSSAHAQGTVQSAIFSFCSDGEDGEGGNGMADGELPIDMRETLRNFGV